MRKFSVITIGRILEELRAGENGYAPLPTLRRQTLYRLEKSLGLYDPNRRTIGKWRIYTPEEAEDLKAEVRRNYRVTNQITA